MFRFTKEEPMRFGNTQTPFIKDITNNLDLQDLLFRNVQKVLPMFSFYIYKVDKKIFKNTRGKSGKYTFI